MANNKYGIIPPSGAFGKEWPGNFVLPQGASGGLSTGGWTIDNRDDLNFGNEGFIQQTFLGASIQNFDLSAGFGSSASNMSIKLVNDEFNKSDGQGFGLGDDPYHNGEFDKFNPPVVGTPVYFKFGKNPATVEQAFRQTFDDLYNVQTLPDRTVTRNAWGFNFPTSEFNPEEFDELPPYFGVDLVNNVIEDRSLLWDLDTNWRGRCHFAFGGILQSYTQNTGTGGAPVYSVSLTDPREILSNVQVVLNNYQGTTFNNKNLINLYGFLEYDPSEALVNTLSSAAEDKGLIAKYVFPDGNIAYTGVFADYSPTNGWQYRLPLSIADIQTQGRTVPSPEGLTDIPFPGYIVNLQDQYYLGFNAGNNLPEFFPITGQGFARRSDAGIPWYRVSQGLAAMFQYYGDLPEEYINAGFGGNINFRGFNYVVDFGGIPTERIPLTYYMDFDQINLLDLANELCEIISHELYVTLLPVIDHPASYDLYQYNQRQVAAGRPANIISGIIRLDAIDKTTQPRYGAIKSYLDNLAARGIDVENKDVGYELANVTTDKFLVGGQEVDMYLFQNERDRDELWTRQKVNNPGNLEYINKQQWDLRFQEQQQILPYYGLLGEKAVSIPRGFGAYQQILLDSRSLNANGVGNYYVATEMELRAALMGYENWKNFLLSYNDTYIEDISEHRATVAAFASQENQIVNVMSDFKLDAGVADLDSGEAKDQIEDLLSQIQNRDYAVTVPRSVWHSDRPGVDADGFPLSPCSPPYGYPLYYGRATKIGIVEAGIGRLLDKKNRIVKDAAKVKKEFENANNPLLKQSKDSLYSYIQNLRKEINEFAKGGVSPDAKQSKDSNFQSNPRYQSLVSQLEKATKVFNNYEEMKENLQRLGKTVALTQNLGKDVGPLGKTLFNIEKTAKKHNENAVKVFEFVKKIAEECLGKKFLVRIPKVANAGYNVNISFHDNDGFNVITGPFGFKPRPLNSTGGLTAADQAFIASSFGNYGSDANSLWQSYLQDYDSKDLSFSSRIPISERYTEGALKCNYNPFIDDWEFNYKPEPQGGYYDYNMFQRNLSVLDGSVPQDKLPQAIRQGMAPLDLNNLLSEGNRLQCYARYNHSDKLDFTSVAPNDMTQQVASQFGNFFPDLVEALPNNSVDAEETFNSIEGIKKDQRLLQRQPDSMAFVKCTLDEKFYMPPNLKQYSLDVYGKDYEFTLSIVPPETVTKQVGCETIVDLVYQTPNPVFSIPKDGGKGDATEWVDFDRYYEAASDSWIINTQVPQLDDEHVYALITVPGRIKSNVDTRWRTGPMQAYNAVEISHLMTQDVVNIPQFNEPNPIGGAERLLPCFDEDLYKFATEEEAIAAASQFFAEPVATYDMRAPHLVPLIIFGQDTGTRLGHYKPGKPSTFDKLSLEDVSKARAIQKTVLKGFAMDDPGVELSYTQPGPIYPDIVAIPLMSQERCYGPWLSASKLDVWTPIKYSDIGGNVEFIKDENLTPWNFAGYQLMNEAGKLQANFSNSLLLFSERGGFVMPDAPTGIALAKALKAEGPIITSIGINVGDNGVKTTVKLDLYTSKFGKLAKQKEDQINRISRERQKLTDEKNAAVRRGLGKRQTSADLVNSVMQGGGNAIEKIASQIAVTAANSQELGKAIDVPIEVVGKDGAVQYSTADFQKLLSNMDASDLGASLSKLLFTPAGREKLLVAMHPDPELPSIDYDNWQSLKQFLNSDNHSE